jgi:hypothetical protein
VLRQEVSLSLCLSLCHRQLPHKHALFQEHIYARYTTGLQPKVQHGAAACVGRAATKRQQRVAVYRDGVDAQQSLVAFVHFRRWRCRCTATTAATLKISVATKQTLMVRGFFFSVHDFCTRAHSA